LKHFQKKVYILDNAIRNKISDGSYNENSIQERSASISI